MPSAAATTAATPTAAPMPAFAPVERLPLLALLVDVDGLEDDVVAVPGVILPDKAV